MSEINPKQAGKCWSCKHCEDIGTFSYEEHLSYMRKCTCSGKDYVDSCSSSCADYIWDGTTTEYWKQTGSSYSSSSSSSSSTSSSLSSSDSSSAPKKSRGFLIAAILIIIVVVGAFAAEKYLGIDLIATITGKQDITAVTEADEHINTQTGYIAASSGLNLRTSPGTSSEIITLMPDGAEVEILKTEDSWAYVKFNGTYGWCSNNYIEISE